MRQILTLLFLVFVFFGCTPKQVVELKLPGKQPVKEKVVPKIKIQLQLLKNLHQLI